MATPPPLSRDPLAVALLVALVVVGVIALASIIINGSLSPDVVGLLAATVGPLAPALVYRSRNGKG